MILTLDAVRADHVPGFGGDSERMPNLARWLAEGRRLTTAYTSAPLTLPAHASLFSGQYAHTHGARVQPATQRVTLPLVQAASARGYETVAFVSARILAVEHSRFADFSRIEPATVDERPASRTVAATVDWLAKAPKTRPLFVWVHLFDAHFPYAPATPVWSNCPPDRRQATLERVAHISATGWAGAAGFNDAWWPACLDDLYTSEIAAMDAALPALREAMARRGKWAWVIAADHGECLGETGIFAQHGGTLEECALRIPLAIGGLAGATPGSEDARLASIVDIAPTLAAALGWSLPAVDGADLLAPAKPPRTIRFETAGIAVKGLDSPLLGGRVDSEKLVYDPRTRVAQAFKIDGGEAKPLREVSPALEALRTELAATPPPPAMRTGHLPVADEKLLRGLGYVQ